MSGENVSGLMSSTKTTQFLSSRISQDYEKDYQIKQTENS